MGVIDVRRGIERLVPDARWDFSVPNEGGTEEQYHSIRWMDDRPKPSWEAIVAALAALPPDPEPTQ